MTNEELLISSLEAEVSKAGYQCARHGDALFIPSIALELFARSPGLKDAMGGRAVSVTFEACPEGATDGIKVFQIGYGRSDYEAARDASNQWCLGVLPALLTYVTQTDQRGDVEKAHMIVAVDETGEQFGWTVYLPPILSRAYGGSPSLDEPEQSAMFKALFDSIHPFAAHKTLFWLECFAARYPERQVDATCRLNNADWAEGRNALLAWATSWQEPGDGILSRRQFLLFKPTPVDSIPKSAELSSLLDEQQALHKRPR